MQGCVSEIGFCCYVWFFFSKCIMYDVVPMYGGFWIEIDGLGMRWIIDWLVGCAKAWDFNASR